MNIRSQKTKLALVLMGALVLIWIIQPFISALLGSEKNSNPSKGLSNMDSQAERLFIDCTLPMTKPTPGVDPFKAHIEKNGFSTQPLEQKPSSAAIQPAGTDPFKVFLEQQKKQSNDASVSPFGR